MPLIKHECVVGDVVFSSAHGRCTVVDVNSDNGTVWIEEEGDDPERHWVDRSDLKPQFEARPTNEVLVKGALKRAIAVLENTLRGDCPKTVENLVRDVHSGLRTDLSGINERTYACLKFYSKQLLPLFQVEEVTRLDHNEAAVEMGYFRAAFDPKDDEVGVRAVLDELRATGHDLLELVHTRDTCAVQR